MQKATTTKTDGDWRRRPGGNSSVLIALSHIAIVSYDWSHDQPRLVTIRCDRIEHDLSSDRIQYRTARPAMPRSPTSRVPRNGNHRTNTCA